MEKLKEAYAEVNPGATIEVQQSDSTTGVNNAIEGVCDIGMASRDLKDSEIEKGAQATVIALDGIAVIVNNDNPVEDMSAEQVKQIYTDVYKRQHNAPHLCGAADYFRSVPRNGCVAEQRPGFGQK